MKLLSRAGKDGATRKKLELASGAILQYVGHVAPRRTRMVQSVFTDAEEVTYADFAAGFHCWHPERAPEMPRVRHSLLKHCAAC